MNIGDEFKDDDGNTLRVVKVAPKVQPCFPLGKMLVRSNDTELRCMIVEIDLQGTYQVIWMTETDRGTASGFLDFRSNDLQTLSDTLRQRGYVEEPQ